MIELVDMFFEYLNAMLLILGIAFILLQIGLMFSSMLQTERWINENKSIDFKKTSQSSLAPSVSLIVHVVGGSISLLDATRSLLTLYYSEKEIIIVNDGLGDDSVPEMIEKYQMVKTDYFIEYHLACKEINAVYKSINPAYKSLILVNKKGGGASDAFNAGINVSSKTLVACINTQLNLDPDAILKMAKPFMQSRSNDLVAVAGSILYKASDDIGCSKKNITKIVHKILVQFQVIRHLNRLLFAQNNTRKLNGLSSFGYAFCVFDRSTLLYAGGVKPYDFEAQSGLVLRLQKYCLQNQKEYFLDFIPEALGQYYIDNVNLVGAKFFKKQTIQILETLRCHGNILFDTQYKMLGGLSFPYLLLLQWLVPFMVLYTSLFFMISVASNGYIFGLLALSLFWFKIMSSLLAIIAQQIANPKCFTNRTIYHLIILAFLEPVYHYFALIGGFLSGNFTYLFSNIFIISKQKRID